MKINLEKTKVVVFRIGGPLRVYETWVYMGSQIEAVFLSKFYMSLNIHSFIHSF